MRRRASPPTEQPELRDAVGPAGAVRAPAPRTVVRDAGDVAALQSAAGNTAVQRILSTRTSEPGRGHAPPRALQRTPTWLKDGQRDPRVVAFGEAVERRVLSAYGFLLANPSLGVHAALAAKDGDGHIGRWLKTWGQFGTGAYPWQMFHAEAGYAIESLATFLALEDAPGGTRAAAQVTVGNTRPDLVLYDAVSGATLCWLDITAKASAGHVEDKTGSWLLAQNAEILYPSFTQSDFGTMQTNDVSPAKPNQMQGDVRYLLAVGMTRNRIEDEEQDLRIAHVKAAVTPLLDAALEGLSAGKRRTMTVEHFKMHVDGSLTLKPIADLLYATGHTVSKYFPKTASVGVPTKLSRRRGQALLAQLAATHNWPNVTLSDQRKAQIRHDVELELFESGTRTLEASMDLEEGQKRDSAPSFDRQHSF